MSMTSAPAPVSAARRPAAWVEDLHVRGQKYVVELLKPAEKSTGGIWLPEKCQENWTHGIVRAAGPGERLLTDGSGYSTMFAAVGDEVIFTKHSFHSTGHPHSHGMVRDEDLVAIVRDEEIVPLNDWVMIAQDEDIKEASATIIYAEEWRPKPTHGVVLDYGPGKLQWKGNLWGIRKPVPLILSLTDAEGWVFVEDDLLKGKRVWWGRDNEMLSVGREHLEALMIAAEDLLFIEEAG